MAESGLFRLLRRCDGHQKALTKGGVAGPASLSEQRSPAVVDHRPGQSYCGRYFYTS